MLISHEVPISLLPESHIISDFEYCLVHLTEQYPEYYNFYKNARPLYDREVLLDNSIFELKKAFDADKFYSAILDLKPNMYIIPDVLEESVETIKNADNWLHRDGRYSSIRSHFNTHAIGAVQGKTWQELVDCYCYMSESVDMIAISFDFSYYQITGEGHNVWEKYVSGRQRFITQLIESGKWNWNKPVHLLGCALPQELSYYRHNNIYNIRSVDTSSPIVHGMHNIKYNSTFGLQFKASKKLADLINHKPSDGEIECIKYNVQKFREIVNG